MAGLIRDLAELEAGLDEVRRSPVAAGTVVAIVRRPAVGARERIASAVLDLEAQVTIMNSRFAALVSGGDGWEQAGDQLFVDLDLGVESLPPGSRLAVG